MSLVDVYRVWDRIGTHTSGNICVTVMVMPLRQLLEEIVYAAYLSFAAWKEESERRVRL
jgi:hypothetical protein